MSKFKVGDEVRDNVEPEDVLTVTEVNDNYIDVVDVFGNGNTYPPYDLFLVKPAPDAVSQLPHNPVSNPFHYKTSRGVDLLDVIEDCPFSRGSIIKYVFRAGKKSDNDELQDLRKAHYLLGREIERVASNQAIKITTEESN